MSERCGVCGDRVGDLKAHLRDEHDVPSLTDVLRDVQKVLPPPSDRDLTDDDDD